MENHWQHPAGHLIEIGERGSMEQGKWKSTGYKENIAGVR